MTLGGGSSITPSELRKMDMNNTKVAFFFACYCGLADQTGDSMATAAVKAGAKASFAYKISSKVLGDRSVSKLIFTEMKFIGIVGIGFICCLIFVILWTGKNPEQNWVQADAGRLD